MVTKNEGVRLAVIEEQIKQVNEKLENSDTQNNKEHTQLFKRVDGIHDKLDSALMQKADKEDFNKLEARVETHIIKQGENDSYWKKNVWNIVIAVFMALIAFLTFLKI